MIFFLKKLNVFIVILLAMLNSTAYSESDFNQIIFVKKIENSSIAKPDNSKNKKSLINQSNARVYYCEFNNDKIEVKNKQLLPFDISDYDSSVLFFNNLNEITILSPLCGLFVDKQRKGRKHMFVIDYSKISNGKPKDMKCLFITNIKSVFTQFYHFSYDYSFSDDGKYVLFPLREYFYLEQPDNKKFDKFILINIEAINKPVKFMETIYAHSSMVHKTEISPNGKYIAYISYSVLNQKVQKSFLYLINMEKKGNYQELYSTDNSIVFKQWSPDSDAILIGETTKSNDIILSELDIKTKKVTKIFITKSKSNYSVLSYSDNVPPSVIWSNSGLFFVNGKDFLYKQNNNTQFEEILKVKELTRIQNLRVSHDGKKILFIGYIKNKIYLCVYSIDQKELAKLFIGFIEEYGSFVRYRAIWREKNKMNILSI